VSKSSVERVSDLVGLAGTMPAKTVIIPGGHRREDLLLVESARDHGIVANCLLVGDHDCIQRATDQVGIEVPDEHIVGTGGPEDTAARTVELVQQGVADIILKGDIPTPILNRAMLKLRVKNTMGLVTMFDAAPIAGDRTMFITDPGVTTECTFGRLVDLIENAADVARAVAGLARPRVALLSANEKIIPSLKSTVVADRLARRKWKDMVVHGPLSFDLATDAGSVSSKGIPKSGPARAVAGKADVLVCPGIDTANAVYKVIMAMVKHGEASMAGVTVGVQVPYVILSRADPLETRLDSIALCCVYSERTRGRRAVRPPAARRKRKAHSILALNPGSTSTKMALFRGGECLYEQELADDPGVLPGQDAVAEVQRRCELVSAFLRSKRVKRLDAVVGRGGFLKRPPRKLAGGTYLVAERKGRGLHLEQDIIDGVALHAEMDHASNLGIPMAAHFAKEFGVPAYAVDPVVVDEFSPEAEFSGYAPIKRKSTSHALSIRAALHRFAADSGREAKEISIVVGHLGGGITVAAVREGRMIDNSIALLGEGPFTPQRTGTLPLKELIDLCYDGGYTKAELIAELTKRGGLVSYLGDHRVERLGAAAEAGDRKVRRVLDAMAYQIAKEIGAMSVAVGVGLEAIVLTGGLVRSQRVLRAIRKRVATLAPVVVYRESLEMAAMAEGVTRVLEGKERPKRYTLRRRRRST
jgi:butyrate kinase